VFSKPEIARITEAIGYASDLQVQTSFQVRALINDKKIKACEDYEEKEGRINCDLLKRLIIVGGPLIQPGPSMQDQLVKQVPPPLCFPSKCLACQHSTYSIAI